MSNLTDIASNLLLANTVLLPSSGTLPYKRMPPAITKHRKNVQPPVVQIQSRNPNPEPNVAPVVAPVVTPIPKASIPFPVKKK
ncbi:hypothetical protein Tco_1018551 [Tanacetum coccineum]|uniref:Uncharacterized protein n=1 Tax=Tanacetum coccineum TaxID=301880 RepID=A0ABQ5FUL4_9ASTR